MFSSQTGDFDIQQKHIDNTGYYVVSSGVQNNGVIGKSSVAARIIPGNTITIDMFGNVFFRDFEYKMVTHARVFSLEADFLKHKGIGLYVSTLLSYLSHKFSYSNMASWNKVKDLFIKFPVNIESKIDYNFIESYMRELEQERIRELEQYLRVTGLDTYALTKREHEILTSHAGGRTRLFRIGDLFNVKKGTRLVKSHMHPGLINFIGSTACNNGITATVSNTGHLHPGNTITVTYNGSVGEAFYQSDTFWASDDVNVLYAKKNLNEYIALFIIPYLRKTGARYGYTFKWTKEKMQNDEIELPVTDSGELDYTYMEAYIRAIEKVVIRGVVEWKNKIIETTKAVVNA